MASLANAQDAKCHVEHKQFANGGKAAGKMKLEQGTPCQFKFRFGRINPPDSWDLVEAPKSGKVVFKDDMAEYQPNAAFTGEDRFTVAIFGKTPNCGTRCNRNGRFEFAVTVTPRQPQ